MTQTGTVLGTSDYIAPEQAQGQPVDEHTDVYSLGVVLYELLTSDVPFPGENFVAVAMRHINEEPPPVRDKRPDVSLRLDEAVRGRWRSGPRTASRRWTPSAPSSRRASPSCREPGRSSRGPRCDGSIGRRFSPLAAARRVVVLAAAVAVGAVLDPAQPRAAERREVGAPADRCSRPCDRGVRPVRRRRRARRGCGQGDRRRSEHVLADRELSHRAEPRQAGGRAGHRRRQGAPAPPARAHDVDAGPDRGDPGGRLPRRAVQRRGRRVPDGRR